MIRPVVVRGKTMERQDCIVLRGTELAVSDVGDPEILDHSAIFELEITEVGHLVRRLARPMGRGDGSES